jgi:hypothetical protein
MTSRSRKVKLGRTTMNAIEVPRANNEAGEVGMMTWPGRTTTMLGGADDDNEAEVTQAQL